MHPDRLTSEGVSTALRRNTGWSPLGQRVLAVTVDQVGELTVVLENGVYLAISSGYGWHLIVGEISDLLRDNIDGEPFEFIDWWESEAVDFSRYAQMQSKKLIGQAAANQSSAQNGSSRKADRN